MQVAVHAEERAPAVAVPRPAARARDSLTLIRPAPPVGVRRRAGDDALLRAGGSALHRAVLARKSKAAGGRCEPSRSITGVVFHPMAEKETAVAKKIIEGSTAALSKQNISLELVRKPFLELFDTDLTTHHGEPNEERMIRTETHLCQVMGALENQRTTSGVVVLVAPFGGEICNGGAIACYMPNLGKHCGTLKNLKRLIVVDTFAPEDELGQVLAHEIGHHADWPQYRHPTEKGNYLNFGKGRDHYSPDVLQNMCGKSMQF
jgi:hypothetical protein